MARIPSFRLLFLLILTLHLQANVVKNRKWYQVTGPEEYAGDFSVSPAGRAVYFGKLENILSIWTARLDHGNPVQWLKIAKENTDGIAKLDGPRRRVICEDGSCYFLSFSNARTSLWKWSEGLPLQQILTTEQITNLGLVSRLEAFQVNAGRVFITGEVGSYGPGIYEIRENSTILLQLALPSTNTHDWDLGNFSINNEAALFLAKGMGKTNMSLFLTDIKTGQTKELIRANERINGTLVQSCCQISSAQNGFIVHFQTHDTGDPAALSKSNLVFIDIRGQITLIAKEANYIITGASAAYAYGVKLAGDTWSTNSVLFTRSMLENGTRKESLSLWRAGVLSLVSEIGDKLYQNGLVDGFNRGGLTIDGRIAIQTFSYNDKPIARLALGISPQITSISPTIAYPNDAITIKGTDLLISDMKAEVEIDGFRTDVSGSANSIIFRVPASVPSGKHEVKLELEDLTGKISVVAGTVEIVNNYLLPSVAAVVNGASFRSGVAPCSIASLFGSNLSQQGAASAVSLPLPGVLAGSQVLVNDNPAPLFFVSPGQINFQVPCELDAGAVTIKVAARDSGGSVFVSNPIGVSVAKEAAGIFRYGPEQLPIVLNENGLVGQANPAEVGKYLVIYATGLGALSPAVKSGYPAPGQEPFARTVDAPVVKIAGKDAEILYSGLTPGFAGLYQINVIVPPDIDSGSKVLEVNSEKVTLRVKN